MSTPVPVLLTIALLPTENSLRNAGATVLGPLGATDEGVASRDVSLHVPIACCDLVQLPYSGLRALPYDVDWLAWHACQGGITSMY